jgi:hypothetical protein
MGTGKASRMSLVGHVELHDMRQAMAVGRQVVEAAGERPRSTLAMPPPLPLRVLRETWGASAIHC